MGERGGPLSYLKISVLADDSSTPLLIKLLFLKVLKESITEVQGVRHLQPSFIRPLHHYLSAHHVPAIEMGTLWVCQGCHSRMSQAGWLQQQKPIFSQLWRQVPAGLVSPEASPRWLPVTFLSSQGHPWSARAACVLTSLLTKMPVAWDQGPPMQPDFTLLASLKALRSQKSHMVRHWGLALQHADFGGESDTFHKVVTRWQM